MQEFDDLEPFSEAELTMLHASKEGLVAKFGNEPPLDAALHLKIRGRVVRMVLLGGTSSFPTHKKGLRLVGAYITEVIDLDHCHCRFRASLEKCTIPGRIVAHHARLAEFSLNGSKIDQLYANFAKFDGGLNLRLGFSAANTVNLSMAKITGSISCDGGQFLAESSVKRWEQRDSINLQHAEVTGSIIFATSPDSNDGSAIFEAKGTVRLTESSVLGSISFIGANISSNDGIAIQGQGANVSGSLHLSREGHGSLKTSGKIDFNSSKIGGQVSCLGAKIVAHPPGNDQHTLIFSWAQIGGSFILRQSEIENGDLKLDYAKIGGQVTLFENTIFHPKDYSVAANNVEIDGSFLCYKCNLGGGVSLLQSNVSGNIEFVDTKISGHYSEKDNENVALFCEAATVSGSIFLRNGFHAIGRTSLSGASVAKSVECIEASFENFDGLCFSADSIEVAGNLVWRRIEKLSGIVTLCGANLGGIGDDLESWPNGSELYLTNLNFEKFALSETNANCRIEWIEDSFEGKLHAQTFLNLSETYRQSGRRSDRKKVLAALEKNARQSERDELRKSGPLGFCLSIFKYFWDIFLGIFVGYGLHPGRALVGAMILISATTICVDEIWKAGDFAPSAAPILVSQNWKEYADNIKISNPAQEWTSRGRGGQDYETFKPFIYAVDIVVPLIDLAQDEAWSVSTERSEVGRIWHDFEWLLRLAGWIIAALLGASVTGLIRSD